MKDLFFTLPKSRQPKYRRLADAIRLAIKDGILQPGEVLPSSRKLAKQFSFNRHTVMNAFSELVAEGWVETKEKQHYQVVSTLPSTFLQAKSGLPSPIAATKRKIMLARPLQIDAFSALRKHRYAFPSGSPDTRLFPLREFKSHLYDALHSQGILQYSDPIGQPRLIEQVSTYLRRVRNIKDKSILITHGSQEAIFLLAQLLIQPGDAVAVEALGYPPAFAALRFAGAKLIPIRVDSEGLVLEHFERQIKQRKIRLLYITPLHQYPTTVTLSASRRLGLYELAYKYNVLILEDDYDHEFHYRSQPVAPLASFDPGGIVLYVSTFSKVLFPSARIGFMAVPDFLAKELAKLKRISSRQNEAILQETIGRWMESGGLERHLRRMRRTYEERLNGLVETLEKIQLTHPEISWKCPDGGMALWLDLGRDSSEAAAIADKHGIFVMPERHYRIDERKGTHLRLGFSGQTRVENHAGLRQLFSLLS